MISDAHARMEALDPIRSFCVTAPAGSGKTELLTQRLLALLARVDQPQQVLAITFTRKAAAEMRSRLLEKLQQARAEDPVSEPHEQVTRDLAIAVLERARRCHWVRSSCARASPACRCTHRQPGCAWTVSGWRTGPGRIRSSAAHCHRWSRPRAGRPPRGHGRVDVVEVRFDDHPVADT